MEFSWHFLVWHVRHYPLIFFPPVQLLLGIEVFLASILKTNLEHLARQVTHGKLSGKPWKKPTKTILDRTHLPTQLFFCGKFHLSKKTIRPPQKKNPRNTCFGWKSKFINSKVAGAAANFRISVGEGMDGQRFSWNIFVGRLFLGEERPVYIYIIYIYYIHIFTVYIGNICWANVKSGWCFLVEDVCAGGIDLLRSAIFGCFPRGSQHQP